MALWEAYFIWGIRILAFAYGLWLGLMFYRLMEEE